MAAVTTDWLLRVALELVGWDEAPADCVVACPGTRLSHILIGTEIGPAELFMARQLGYHAAVSYDPLGTTGALGHDWQRERERLEAAEVPADDAGREIASLAARDTLDALGHDYERAAALARLLEMPFVVLGSAFDELARRRVQEAANACLDAQPGASLSDLRTALLVLPELSTAWTQPALALGAWGAPAGRVLALPGWVARAAPELARLYLTHGVDTLCCSEMSSALTLRLAEEGMHGNVLVLGRVATASLGMSPYAARLRMEGLEVTTLAGTAS
jgi:hypothetical protein